jgi:hypothetical protein
MVWSCKKDVWKEIDKKIYEADLGGNAGRGRRTFQIGEVLEKGQVKLLFIH